MSLSTVHFILKKHLKVRNIFARWVPHLLTDEQNRQLELVRKVSNKILATKHSRHPIIVKRSLSATKVWYAIFFSGEGVAIKVLVEKGKKITGKDYKDI